METAVGGATLSLGAGEGEGNAASRILLTWLFPRCDCCLLPVILTHQRRDNFLPAGFLPITPPAPIPNETE